jgi:hypothetical protein
MNILDVQILVHVQAPIGNSGLDEWDVPVEGAEELSNVRVTANLQNKILERCYLLSKSSRDKR